MSRLHNRMLKADFYTDGELLRWPRGKRFFYQSLWAMAEDCCCIDNDPFEWKCTAWPSPLDDDITVEQLEKWRDELISEGKLIEYTQSGKSYLYIPGMAKYEHPRNPQPSDIPLPFWVTHEVKGVGKGLRHQYTHSDEFLYTTDTDSPEQNRVEQSRTKDYAEEGRVHSSPLLDVLQRYRNWNGDTWAEQNEAAFRDDFPTLDLVTVAKDWVVWAQEARRPPVNCWSSFRNWCKRIAIQEGAVHEHF